MTRIHTCVTRIHTVPLFILLFQQFAKHDPPCTPVIRFHTYATPFHTFVTRFHTSFALSRHPGPRPCKENAPSNRVCCTASKICACP